MEEDDSDFDFDYDDGEENDSEDEEGHRIIPDDELVDFLESLNEDIHNKHNAPAFEDIKHLRAEIGLLPGQASAAGVIAQAKNSRFRGIVIGDPPRYGKTLSSLLVPIAEKTKAGGPVVVVTVEDVARQWVTEIHKFFEEPVSVLLLDDTEATEEELSKYTVVVTSYENLLDEYNRMETYFESLREYDEAKRRGIEVNPPERPTVALLSGTWDMGPVKPLAKYLIVDEVHTIRKVKSDKYAAVKKLRSRIDVCVMLTMIPLEDNWTDTFAYLSLLSGHPFKSKRDFRRAFTDYDTSKRLSQTFPTGEYLTRISQLLDSFILRRPP